MLDHREMQPAIDRDHVRRNDGAIGESPLDTTLEADLENEKAGGEGIEIGVTAESVRGIETGEGRHEVTTHQYLCLEDFC